MLFHGNIIKSKERHTQNFHLLLLLFLLLLPRLHQERTMFSSLDTLTTILSKLSEISLRKQTQSTSHSLLPVGELRRKLLTLSITLQSTQRRRVITRRFSSKSLVPLHSLLLDVDKSAIDSMERLKVEKLLMKFTHIRSPQTRSKRKLLLNGRRLRKLLLTPQLLLLHHQPPWKVKK